MPNDYSVARKARGIPKVSMTVTAAPDLPAPVDKTIQPKQGTKEFLNEDNNYDPNTYTPEQRIDIAGKKSLSRT
jgi:hypothetical protein